MSEGPLTEAELAVMEEEYGSQCAGHERRLVPEVRRLQKLNGYLVKALERIARNGPHLAVERANSALKLAGKP